MISKIAREITQRGKRMQSGDRKAEMYEAAVNVRGTLSSSTPFASTGLPSKTMIKYSRGNT